MTKSNNSELQTKAKELVEKHGNKAVEIAERKVSAFKSDCREKDFALMLLTAVEKIVGSLD